jgi:CheY-like chemotaxis protein
MGMQQTHCWSRRILIIDDDPDIVEAMGELLTDLGHTVATALSGPLGLNSARGFRPHVVFCDIGLPGMSGHDVARALRAEPELGTVYLVAVTGYVQPDDVALAKAAGFDCHLAKPPRIELIERLLAEIPDIPLGA